MAGIVLKTGGTENNGGTISGAAYGVEIYGGVGTVLNSGYITANYSGGYGVLLKNGGSVSNEAGGYIGGATAVSLLDGGTITNAEGALIESAPSGNSVAVNVAGAAGTLLNSGVIVASSPSSTFAAVFLGAGGKVTNSLSGEIRAGASARAISVQGGAGQVVNAGLISAGVSAISLAAGGTVTNSGSIYGHVSIAGVGGSVINSGSIFDAGSSSSNDPGIGVSIRGHAAITNQAGAYIGGGGTNGFGISVYGGGAVINAGTIAGTQGAIKFAGAGANTLTLQTGSALNGVVVGSTAQGAANALVLTGSGVTNNAFLNFNTLSLQGGGSWRLGGVSTIGATSLSTGTLTITGTFSTVLNQLAGSAVTIGKGAKLDLGGASTIGGSLNGAGSLVVGGGATTIAASAHFTVLHWSILGATAQVTIDKALAYEGGFTVGSGAVVNVSSGPLALSGTVVFSGAEIIGTKKVTDRATTSVTGLTLGGTGGFVNDGVLSQSGAVVLGDSQGHTTLLDNAAGAAWDIISNSGVALGVSQASTIANAGLFEKTGGAQVSAISPAFDNAGKVLVSAGTLDFQGAVNGSGVDTISGAATLEFDAIVSDTQTISFTGSDGVLELSSPTTFSGLISGFGAVGAKAGIELLGSWTISGYAQHSASQGWLTVSNGTQSDTLAFDGNYGGASLFGASVGSGHTMITYF